MAWSDFYDFSTFCAAQAMNVAADSFLNFWFETFQLHIFRIEVFPFCIFWFHKITQTLLFFRQKQECISPFPQFVALRGLNGYQKPGFTS